MFKIKRIINFCKFKKNNPGVIVDLSTEIKLPNCILCGKNVSIGENSKLLCWDSFNR